MASKSVLDIVVQAITIKPSEDTTMNGKIFPLILFGRGQFLGNSTSHMQSMASRNTENAPIPPTKEKLTTTTAVQGEVNGDPVPTIKSLNSCAIAGPARAVICCMIIWTACSCPINWPKKDMMIKSKVGRGKIMKKVRAAARIGAS